MQKSELVSARLSPKEIDEIERLVGDGFYMNTADFVRMAVREKLESIKVIDIRNVTKEKAMKEVIEYLKKNNGERKDTDKYYCNNGNIPLSY